MLADLILSNKTKMIVDLSQGDSRVQVLQPREMRAPNDYYEGHGEMPEPEPQPEVIAQ